MVLALDFSNNAKLYILRPWTRTKFQGKVHTGTICSYVLINSRCLVG
jgi:hypothetical protein